MKQVLMFLVVAMAGVFAVQGVAQDGGDEHVYMAVERMPVFPGGEAELMRWIDGHIVYPPKALAEGVDGDVILQFVVLKTGKIGDVKIVRGVSPEIDAEAERVVKALPDFKPGKQNNKPVNVWYTTVVTFRLP